MALVSYQAFTCHLARLAAASRHGGLYVVLLFLIYLFLTIPIRPNTAL